MAMSADTGVRDDDTSTSDFHVAVGAEPGGEARVLVTFDHVRWLFTPEKAVEFSVVLAEAAAQAHRHSRDGRS